MQHRTRIVVLVCALAAAAGGAASGAPPPVESDAARADRGRPDVVVRGRVAGASTRRPKPAPGFLIVQVKAGLAATVRSRPNGPILTKLESWTEFGSPRSLAVLSVRRGRWLGVVSPELGNGRVGWIDARAHAVTYSRTRVALEADLSRRELRVRVHKRIVRRMSVSIGRPGSSTPIGRFAVTDKLSGRRFGSFYGCCILALSGHQPNLPAGWTGGDRLAIHGTPDESRIGDRSSAGCLRARGRDLAWLMRAVPLGTQIVIHP
jgi:L,D-transpeptidase catalytic domain